ncbi:hypothetical protein K4F52_000133 [Lecanicillium sp. MT-2017a]|nr:hypothetical protein K4F52_000133 [Lecanicillium sp. MT-2017a]
MILRRQTPWRLIYSIRNNQFSSSVSKQNHPLCPCRRNYSSSSSDDAPPSPPSPDGDKLIYPQSPTTQHSDLASFLSYAQRTGLDESSTVYVGTHYEYTVAAALARYGFYLRRIGGASDRGTDLVGTWSLPTAQDEKKPQTQLRILMQCKAGSGQRVGPQHVRELEGAFAGAPVGWRGTTGVLAVLACERAATKGVREALGYSRWPMAYVFCERGAGGVMRQMLWNRRAEEMGLEGIGVGTRHVASGEEGEDWTELVLMSKGRALPFVEASEGGE